MAQFRYTMSAGYEAALVQLLEADRILVSLSFNRQQMEAYLAELGNARPAADRGRYVDPRTGVAFNRPQLDAHYAQLNSLYRTLGHKPYIDPLTGVNLEQPPLSPGASGDRPAGPARGGSGAGAGIDPAWQGFGPGPGAGSSGSGGHGL